MSLADFNFPQNETFDEKDIKWRQFCEHLYPSLRYALANGEKLNFSAIQRELALWEHFVKDYPFEKDRDKIVEQWNTASRLVWCASHRTKFNGADELRKLKDEPEYKYIQGHEPWVWNFILVFRWVNVAGRSLEIPFAVEDRGKGNGYLRKLVLQKLENGTGHLFYDPEQIAETPVDQEFQESMQDAWTAAKNLARNVTKVDHYDVRWWLLGEDSLPLDKTIEGRSASGNAARAMYDLITGRAHDDSVIALAQVDKNGTLADIGGIRAKVKAIVASRKYDTIIVVSEHNKDEVQ